MVAQRVPATVLTVPPWMLFIGQEKGFLDSSFDPGVNIYCDMIFRFRISLASQSVSLKQDCFLLRVGNRMLQDVSPTLPRMVSFGRNYLI